jgi:hypothetical protein
MAKGFPVYVENMVKLPPLPPYNYHYMRFRAAIAGLEQLFGPFPSTLNDDLAFYLDPEILVQGSSLRLGLVPSKTLSIHDIICSGLFAQIITLDIVTKALEKHSKESQRVRLLPAPVIVYFVMMMNLWRDSSIENVLKNICQGLKAIDPSFNFDKFPSKSAICKAREKVGDDVLSSIADLVLKPIAKLGTIGAWYKDKRLMAFDGTCFKVPDEKNNASYFGYPSSHKGEPGFPECRVLGLVELGTRVIVRAAIGAYSDSEIKLTHQLLESSPLTPEMLLLADRNFYSYQLWNKCAESGASLLWRVKKNLKLNEKKRLPDGSYLADVKDSRDKSQPPITVRVIQYDLDNEELSSDEEKDEKYILITNMFDHKQYPASELAALYHERWEIEIAFGEIKNTLNSNSVLRSKKPELVKQEIWGLIISHFAIRQLMVKAALDHDKDPDDLSFKGSAEAIKRSIPLAASLPPEKLIEWKDSLIEEIASAKCQRGKGKTNPRGVKCQIKPFPVRRRGQQLNQKRKYFIRVLVS